MSAEENLHADEATVDAIPRSQSPLISVVVAIYRSPELLVECLSSLAGEHTTDVEFLLMDDASPDCCGSICDEWAARDHRFQAHHVEHGGISWVRNLGVASARGDYIIFVDGDDRICPGILDTLVQLLPTVEYDLIYFPHLRVPQDRADRRDNTNTGTLLPGPDPFDVACAITSWSDRSALGPLRNQSISLATAWGKVFRRSFLRQHGCMSPIGNRIGQDRVLMLEILSHDPRSASLDYIGYVYVNNPTSVTRLYDPEIAQNVRQSERYIAETILRCYEGERQNRLMMLTSYQRFRYFTALCHRYYFAFGANPAAGRQLAEFRIACAERADDFSRCHASLVGSWRWRLMLALLKLRWYSLLYRLLVGYYWTRWKRAR